MMQIRKWAKEDIFEIAKLESVCFEKGAWSEQMLEDSFCLDTFYSLLIEEKGEIFAYLGATVTKWEGEILLVATAPSFRRRGYANKLITCFLNYAHIVGLEKVFLEVRESNFKAISLYEKMGFKQYNRRKGYYENTEDAINMVYTVKE